jgi:hypothetical protein
MDARMREGACAGYCMRQLSIKILRREPFRAATMRPERPGTHVQRIDVGSTKSLSERYVDEKSEKSEKEHAIVASASIRRT